jgi:hypothetical protein
MRLLAALVLLIPSLALAQSAPSLQLNFVPSPTQWMGYFSSKTDVTNGTLNGPTINGNISGSPTFTGAPTISVLPTGATTSRALSELFAQVVNVKDFGAKGDGSTDDSAAIAAAINSAISHANGKRPSVYLPGGTYRLAGTALPLITVPISIYGDGEHSTYLQVSQSYVGTDVFSFSEVWIKSAYINPLLSSADPAGINLRGFTIIGDSAAASQQNAFSFYDRDDFVVMKDIEVFLMNGRCLWFGATKNQSQAYLRESRIDHVRCSHTGTSTAPAVEISSTSASGSDATNTNTFSGLNIINSISSGLVIRNPNNFSATRVMDFFGLRVEISGADNIDIGLSSDSGQVEGIHVYGMANISPGATNAGFYGLNIDPGSTQAYDITVIGGFIGPCNGSTSCNGVRLNNTRLTEIRLENIQTAGPNVTAGPSLGGQVEVNGNGSEQGWTYSIDAAVPQKLLTPIRKQGDPSASSSSSAALPSVTSVVPDSSASFGNLRGAGAVDLMQDRNGATQVAGGTDSVVIGGQQNIVGTSASFSAIIGGAGNTVSAAKTFMGASQQASDRGRPGSQVFSVGANLTPGDAQSVRTIFRAVSTGGATAVLTENGGAAGTANILNISANQSYSLRTQCEARDTTTAGTDVTTVWPISLLTRDATIGTTAVSLGTPATVSRGTVTGASFAITADTTNGGLHVLWTPPTGNNDTFHLVCLLEDVEVQ